MEASHVERADARADRTHRARQNSCGGGGTHRKAGSLRGGEKLNAHLGLTSLDLAFLVAELDAQLGVDPFARLVSITSVRTVDDLVRAYQQAIFPDLQAGGEADALAAAVKRGSIRRARRERR